MPALRRCGRSGGFSLIEVLVAILILSVGILGVAGLQLMSLQNNTNSLQRTRAFTYAYEIIDRARANPDQDYSLAMDAAAPGGVDCEIQNCIPSQLRDYDQTVWKNDLAALLPAGNGSVAMAGSTMTVTVQWQDDRRNLAAGPIEISVSTIL
ncbi:MAG TPA: type IV pilus modification protein PilV [Pseudomonadales bacterium]|nr:type IV pilus modification protein PilV [Pseudomonadales bacterium]